MPRLVGYTDRPSVRPGESIRCHVSLVCDAADAVAEYTTRLVRIVGVDPHDGRERIEPVPSPIEARRIARVEPTTTGGYGIAKLRAAPEAAPALDAALTFMPTLLDGREQTLVSVCDATSGTIEQLALTLDRASRPVVLVGGAGPGAARFALPCRVEAGRWYRVSAGFAQGEVHAAITGLDDPGADDAQRSWRLTAAPAIVDATVVLAARPQAGEDPVGLGTNFTGRIESPSLAVSGRTLASWDFTREQHSFAFRDTSGNDHHGTLHGLPARGVTGASWDGAASSFEDAPAQFGAIHFCADAIEDAGWPTAFTADIPPSLPSGLYGFVLEGPGDRETVPFVVAPAPGATEAADLLLVLPTATYMAYANARFTWEKVNWEVQRGRTVELGRSEQILLARPDLGASSYDQHRDGSNITSISWRRPNLDMRTGQNRGEAYPSDLQLVEWLERQGRRYDVCSDDDLDRGGLDLLGRYRVALTGTHPEYASSRGYAALEAFLAQGGRLAVLGGDVYTWLVAFSDERPWVMEARKPDNRPAGTRAAAEAHLALTGEHSGEPERPRPAERLLGTSSASMGFDAPRPYERLAASDEPDAAFVFAGVDARVIGGDGLSGGVVFQEWDNTEDVSGFAWGPERPTVLARSTGHSVTTRWFGAGKRRSHAEMTFFAIDGGGAVFSAGTMAWCPALDRPDVSRVTANVLDRFLDPAPFAHGRPRRAQRDGDELAARS